MSATAAAPGPVTTTTAGSHPQAVYSRVAGLGLLLLATAPLLLVVVAAVSGVSLAEMGPIFGAAAVIPLIASPLTWRFGTWAKIVAIVVALLAAGTLFWVAFGLGFPASFGDFVPAVAFVLGVALTVGGAIAAIVQGRRHNVTAVATQRERQIIVAAGALVVVAMAVSGTLTLLASRSAASASGTPVAMADFSFGEEAYTVAAGAPATLVVHNNDGFMHDITVPELGVDVVRVNPGADAVIEIPASSAGSYTMYCSLHSNTSVKDPQAAGMAATLVVE